MANAIVHAGTPFPVWGRKYTVIIPYLDADGDPVDPTSPDTEISKDGGTFADCTNEVTVITGGNGVGYITLTASEMQASVVTIAAKSTNAKTTILTINPYGLVPIGGDLMDVPIVSISDPNHIFVAPTSIAAIFGGTVLNLQGLWLLFASSTVDDMHARPISFYDPDAGELGVFPNYEVGTIVAGQNVIFGFPVGTGTVLEQIIRSGGGFIR